MEIIKMKEVVLSEQTKAGDILSIVFDLEKEIKSEYFESVFNLRSNEFTHKKARSGVHWYGTARVSELDRIMDYPFIYKWIIDNNIEDNSLIAEDLSDEDKRRYNRKKRLDIIEEIELKIRELKKLNYNNV